MQSDLAPDNYRYAAMLMVLAGGMNVFWGGMWSLGLLFSTFSGVLCGPCCCFVPLALVPIGIYEVVTGVRMLRGERVPSAARVAPFVMIGSALTMGFTMTLCELGVTLLLHRPEVKTWLEEPT